MDDMHSKAKKGQFDEDLTTEMLNKADESGNTVWHIAAMYKKLKYIPEHLFTKEALNKINKDGDNVWYYAILKYIPEHIITEELLEMRNREGNKIFDQNDTNYIKHIIELPKKLKSFIKNHPNLERDIEFKDDRLKLIRASEEKLVFKFSCIDDQICLSKDGVFINHNTENHKILNKVVEFIQKECPGIEKSITLPKTHIKVESFVL